MMSERDEDGTFAQGNQFWKQRSSHGAKPKFETPEQLWDACEQYFDWNDTNPLYEEKGFAFQGKVTKETFAKVRAMTMAGLWQFIDISPDTWCEWKKSRPDLSEVISRVEQTVYRQKFEGAAADLLNQNIIARDLGLSDKQETKHSGEVEMKTLAHFYGDETQDPDA